MIHRTFGERETVGEQQFRKERGKKAPCFVDKRHMGGIEGMNLGVADEN